MEGDTTFEDVKDALDPDNLPIQIHGRVLLPHELIQDINVADNEPLILELKVGLDDTSKNPWAYSVQQNVKKAAFKYKSTLPEDMQKIEDHD